MRDPRLIELRPLLSVDPGLRGIGAAMWSSKGELIKACYVKGTKVEDGAGAWNALVENLGMKADPNFTLLDMASEFPQIYVKRVTDPEDLLQLAAVVGALSVFPVKTTLYRPREWKGQIPKPDPGQTYIIEERCRKRLSEDEVLNVEDPGNRKLSWDVWDAVGIGLHHLGRLRA